MFFTGNYRVCTDQLMDKKRRKPHFHQQTDEQINLFSWWTGWKETKTMLTTALMMEAARTSETLVNFYQTTRCYNPEDSNLHAHNRPQRRTKGHPNPTFNPKSIQMRYALMILTR
jgi:hypothetical protein